MGSVTEEYEFIVVGGGTSGSVLASRLARSASAPSVLLLEGGGSNNDPALRSPEKRWTIAFTEPLTNWGYMSTPQKQLTGQQIPCIRGKGLGGSSAINFSGWQVGHREDFNHWADEVDDPIWKWEGEKGVKQRFRKIERIHPEAAMGPDQTAFVDVKAQALHSTEGFVDLQFPDHWNALTKAWFKTAQGLGLTSPPINLTIKTYSPVSRVIFDSSKKAVGVETVSGETFKASKEIILSAGAIDSPKILLLSGIGPMVELSLHQIPIIQDLPGVGKNLRDHCLATYTILTKPGALADVPTAEEIPDAAATNPIITRDPLRAMGNQCPMAWLDSKEVKSSAEFSSLDQKKKDYLVKVPSYELMVMDLPMSVEVMSRLKPNDQVITFAAAVQNNVSVGSVTIASKDPKDHPVVDINYLSHPFDCRIAIESLRFIIEFSKQPTWASITEKVIEGPNGDSDKALLDHYKKSLSPIFHFIGTCKMGKEDDDMAVVNKDFRVRGVERLRVVDVSIAPVLPNNHTQSTAYLVGETAAEKIIEEYGL